jgi:hypothetical protein
MTGALDTFGLRLPQPAWRVLDAVRAHGFTGELVLTGTPAVRVYADGGRIYLAEPVGLAPLGPRLVAAGALTPDEYARGVLRVDGDDRLDALFARVPSVDRHVVIATVAAITDAALRGIAGQVLAAAEVLPYTFHPSGVHLWDEPPRVGAPGVVPPGAAPAPPVFTAPAGPRTADPPPAPYWPSAAPGEAPPASEPRASAPTSDAPDESDDDRFADIVRWEQTPYVHEVSAGLVGARAAASRPAAGLPDEPPADELGEFEVIWPDGDVEPPHVEPPHVEPTHGRRAAVLPDDEAVPEPEWSTEGDSLAVRRAVAMIDTGSLAVRRRRQIPDPRR